MRTHRGVITRSQPLLKKRRGLSPYQEVMAHYASLLSGTDFVGTVNSLVVTVPTDTYHCVKAHGGVYETTQNEPKGE